MEMAAIEKQAKLADEFHTLSCLCALYFDVVWNRQVTTIHFNNPTIA